MADGGGVCQLRNFGAYRAFRSNHARGQVEFVQLRSKTAAGGHAQPVEVRRLLPGLRRKSARRSISR